MKGTGQSQLPEPSFQKLATNQRGENHLWVSGAAGVGGWGETSAPAPLLIPERVISGHWGVGGELGMDKRKFFGLFFSWILAAALHCLGLRGNESFGLAGSHPKGNWSTLAGPQLLRAPFLGWAFSENGKFLCVAPRELIAYPQATMIECI